MVWNCLVVGCGGFIGSVLRYLCSLIRFDTISFPVITLCINVVGSFSILFLTGLFAKSLPLDGHLMLFLRVGLCGGFTTFSTFSAEALSLLQEGNAILGIIYVASSCILCIAAALAGEVSSSAIAAQ